VSDAREQARSRNDLLALRASLVAERERRQRRRARSLRLAAMSDEALAAAIADAEALLTVDAGGAS
jgi:hypothetical protein